MDGNRAECGGNSGSRAAHPRPQGNAIVPGDEDCRSAGSFFQKSVLTEVQHEGLKKRAATRSLNVPSYPALETRKKVSAAWLVGAFRVSERIWIGAGGYFTQTRSCNRQSRRSLGC